VLGAAASLFSRQNFVLAADEAPQDIRIPECHGINIMGTKQADSLAGSFDWHCLSVK